MTCLSFTRLSAGASLVVALTASADAHGHYYAVLIASDSPGNDEEGDFIQIETDILHQTCNFPQFDFVNHEMWYLTSTNGQFWIEVGFKDGAGFFGIDCHPGVGFWADQRTGGGGYNEHYPSGFNLTLGQLGSLQISASTTTRCAWDVLFNNGTGWATVGTSTSNCPLSGRVLEAGIESTSQTSGSAKGFLSNWFEQNQSGQWNPNWVGQRVVAQDDNKVGIGNPRIKFINNQTETEEVLNENF